MGSPQSIDKKSSIVVTESPEGLAAIHHPNCAATLWQRQPLPSFQRWIDSLDPTCLPKARLIVQRNCVKDATTQVCDLCGTPDCEERSRLIDDVAFNAHVFSELLNTTNLVLRLEVVTTSTCRQFHLDAVIARLVCTYRGTGTQYALATAGSQPVRVYTAPTGAPVLMRGTLWPEHPNYDLLHRSPPGNVAGEARLVMSLEPVPDSVPDTTPRAALVGQSHSPVIH